MNIREAFESVNDFSQAKNNGEPYNRVFPDYSRFVVWMDSVASEMAELAVADDLIEQIDAVVDAMYYTADFAACCGYEFERQKYSIEDGAGPDEPILMTQDQIEELRSCIFTTTMLKYKGATLAKHIEWILSEVFFRLVQDFRSKAGVDPLLFFEIVHKANMKKINPETKCAYVYKPNGNIGKPEDFVGPEEDIKAKAVELGFWIV
jgi:predicted HAD superfamily Cof-like phosphohydrolase